MSEMCFSLKFTFEKHHLPEAPLPSRSAPPPFTSTIQSGTKASKLADNKLAKFKGFSYQTATKKGKDLKHPCGSSCTSIIQCQFTQSSKNKKTKTRHVSIMQNKPSTDGWHVKHLHYWKSNKDLQVQSKYEKKNMIELKRVQVTTTTTTQHKRGAESQPPSRPTVRHDVHTLHFSLRPLFQRTDIFKHWLKNIERESEGSILTYIQLNIWQESHLFLILYPVHV